MELLEDLNLSGTSSARTLIHAISALPGNALLRRLVRIGVLDEGKMKLDYILGLKIEDFLERRLQTQVFKLGLAKSIHHARVLIRQRHIRYYLAGSPRPPPSPLNVALTKLAVPVLSPVQPLEVTKI